MWQEGFVWTPNLLFLQQNTHICLFICVSCCRSRWNLSYVNFVFVFKWTISFSERGLVQQKTVTNTQTERVTFVYELNQFYKRWSRCLAHTGGSFSTVDLDAPDDGRPWKQQHKGFIFSFQTSQWTKYSNFHSRIINQKQVKHRNFTL